MCACANPPSRAICLACGECVCAIDTPRRAECLIAHARRCGAGVGLYILAGNSAVVLVRERRVMLRGSPYRDAHGETDLGLVRGKPLSLDRTEYAALERQWIGLSFDETARVDENELIGF